MNLRVDLILPTEQRSASVLNVKSLVRIGIVVVPLIVVIAIVFAVMNMIQSQRDFTRLQAQWKDAEPRKQAAAKLRAQLGGNESLARKVTGWASSRTLWDEQLRGIQKELPLEVRIRLNRLTLNSTVSLDGKTPIRTGMMVLQGAAYGEKAEANLLHLQQTLPQSSVLSGFVDKVEVPWVNANTAPKAGKHDRVFQIDIQYKARKFE